MPDPIFFCRPRVRVPRRDARDADAWFELGVALTDLGDRLGALLALRHALSRDDAHVASHLALGRLLFDCGQVEHALQCFERADSFPS